MDQRDNKRRRIMSTQDESVIRDHDKQETDDAQFVASGDSANTNEELSTSGSDIVDLNTEEFKVVKTKLTFVDKSECIKGFFQCISSGIHITAPRRFGKSTFMNMLELFLMITVDEDAKPISNSESSDNYKMFMSLKLGQRHSNFVKKHCGQYPVISISFKMVQGETETAALDSLKKVICAAFQKHSYLLETAPDGSKSFKNKKMSGEIKKFLKYYERRRLEELSETNVRYALKFLSEILYTHFNKKVVILVDDADAPIMKAITDNMGDETLEYLMRLLRDMLSTALKGNEFLERSLVSSVVRLSGVYSWHLNNQCHALFLQNECFSETYGFTREEVENLLKKNEFQDANDLVGIKKWYDGYQILSQNEGRIYNGWSVIQYLSNSIQESKKMFQHYWPKSSWVNILGKLFVNHKIREAVDRLVKGKSIAISVSHATIDDILELKRLISNPQNQFNKSQVDFFLQLLWDDGLLSAVEKYQYAAKLRIPNLENKKAIRRKCYTQSFFEVNYMLKSINIERYIQALKKLLQITSNEEESEIKKYEEETAKKFEEAMCNLVEAVSFLFSDDATIPVDESELHDILFYLAYNNKLFATESQRSVVKVSEELREDLPDSAHPKKLPRSKAECDMCVSFDTGAVIIEFKFLKDEKPENSKAALQQIIDNKYFTLFDKEEYKHVKTKIYVGLCVRKNLNVTAHYLVDDIDLDKAKNVAACVNE